MATNGDNSVIESRQIKFSKWGNDRQKKEKRPSTLLFVHQKSREKFESGDILFAMIADLEQKSQIATPSELRQMLNAFFVDLRPKAHCGSIFGPRQYISAMIGNEVETLLNAKDDDNSSACAIMLLLWNGQLFDAINVSRRLNVRMDILDQVIDADQTNDDRKLRKLAESLLKDGRYHEYVTCRLHMSDLIEKNLDCINILLKHKYYWDAMVLARRYLSDNSPLLKKTFENWRKICIMRNNHEDTAKCNILMGEIDLAAAEMAKMTESISAQLTTCRLIRIHIRQIDGNDINAVIVANANSQHLSIIAIRQTIALCHWTVAEKLINLMNIDAAMKCLITMHQSLVYGIRLSSYSTIHSSDRFLHELGEHRFPLWVLDQSKNQIALLTGIWLHWNKHFGIDVNNCDNWIDRLSKLNITNDMVDVDVVVVKRSQMLIIASHQLCIGLLQTMCGRHIDAIATFQQTLKDLGIDQIGVELTRLMKAQIATNTNGDAQLTELGNIISEAMD